jgi:hypothetical protein
VAAFVPSAGFHNQQSLFSRSIPQLQRVQAKFCMRNDGLWGRTQGRIVMAMKHTIVSGLLAANLMLASGLVCAAGQYGPGARASFSVSRHRQG